MYRRLKHALKHHVTHVLCPDFKPDVTDRSYYPTSTDVRNHIYKAQHACQLSKLDQENLQLKIEKWVLSQQYFLIARPTSVIFTESSVGNAG